MLVEGLKGNHCRDRVEHVLSHLTGVRQVSVDLMHSRVAVDYDPSAVSEEDIKETLTSLGYAPRRQNS